MTVDRPLKLEEIQERNKEKAAGKTISNIAKRYYKVSVSLMIVRLIVPSGN